MQNPTFLDILFSYPPGAYAKITGNAENRRLAGTALFYPAFDGTLVAVEAFHLPTTDNTADSSLFYGMHIHENGDCTLPFGNTGNHYNPSDAAHPFHGGDLPPLLGNDGYAFSIFFTSRFRPADIIGRSIILHNRPDDFTTQPSGNSGAKIGCGTIVQV